MLGNRFLAATFIIAAGSLIAQQHQVTTGASVPFVGCPSDGQVGPVEAPIGKRQVVLIRAELAQRLAYYSSAQGIGVLAPRGWFCFGSYGSGGERLYVSPERVDAQNPFSQKWSGFLGPAIELTHRLGDTIGRFDVATIIARVFPAYKTFATNLTEELGPNSFSFGPYPKDRLTYKSKTVVEYSTPAQTDGLGTHSALKKNDNPIEGVAILIEQAPDLLLLAVRLPPDLTGLSYAIIHQVERDAERRPQPPRIH